MAIRTADKNDSSRMVFDRSMQVSSKNDAIFDRDIDGFNGVVTGLRRQSQKPSRSEDEFLLRRRQQEANDHSPYRQDLRASTFLSPETIEAIVRTSSLPT